MHLNYGKALLLLCLHHSAAYLVNTGEADETLYLALKEKPADLDGKMSAHHDIDAVAPRYVINEQRFLPRSIVDELLCVDCVCKANNRSYSIAEGTLMGAHRNGFFLPWDSDGDVVFDARAPNGNEDLEGFYKMFSKGSITPLLETQCTVCKDVTLTLFTPGMKTHSGVRLHHFQTYDDILRGNLVEHVEGATKQAYYNISKTEHDKLLSQLRRGPWPGQGPRIFKNPTPEIRTAGDFLDVEPYFVKDGHFKGQWGPDSIEGSEDDALPLKRCKFLYHNPDRIETVELSCFNKPANLLTQKYGKNWTTTPFNKFIADDGSSLRNGSAPGQWTKDPNSPPLEVYLAAQF